MEEEAEGDRMSQKKREIKARRDVGLEAMQNNDKSGSRGDKNDNFYVII